MIRKQNRKRDQGNRKETINERGREEEWKKMERKGLRNGEVEQIVKEIERKQNKETR